VEASIATSDGGVRARRCSSLRRLRSAGPEARHQRSRQER
jgi:hypothetical protein